MKRTEEIVIGVYLYRSSRSDASVWASSSDGCKGYWCLSWLFRQWVGQKIQGGIYYRGELVEDKEVLIAFCICDAWFLTCWRMLPWWWNTSALCDLWRLSPNYLDQWSSRGKSWAGLDNRIFGALFILVLEPNYVKRLDGGRCIWSIHLMHPDQWRQRLQ